MFGFLPASAALAATASLWVARASIPALDRPSEQQPGAAGADDAAALGCSAVPASAFWNGFSLPDAAA